MDQQHDVVTAVLVSDSRVLLVHRHPERQWYPNVWDLPGGHIDAGEAPAQAVRRELREELDIEIQFDSDAPFRVLNPTPMLRLSAWTVTEWNGELRNMAPDEHDDLGWFTLDEASDLDLVDIDLLPLLADAVDQACST